MEETLTEKHPYWSFIIALIITSLGAFIIHSFFNEGVDWNVYFMWLPISWLGVLVLAFIFSLITKTNKKNNE